MVPRAAPLQVTGSKKNVFSKMKFKLVNNSLLLFQDESFRNEPKEEESIQIPDEHSIDSDIEDKPEVPTLQGIQ